MSDGTGRLLWSDDMDRLCRDVEIRDEHGFRWAGIAWHPNKADVVIWIARDYCHLRDDVVALAYRTFPECEGHSCPSMGEDHD